MRRALIEDVDERPDGADAAPLLRAAATRRSRQVLDIDEKTVKSRLFEARHRLREHAEGDLQDDVK